MRGFDGRAGQWRLSRGVGLALTVNTQEALQFLKREIAKQSTGGTPVADLIAALNDGGKEDPVNGNRPAFAAGTLSAGSCQVVIDGLAAGNSLPTTSTILRVYGFSQDLNDPTAVAVLPVVNVTVE